MSDSLHASHAIRMPDGDMEPTHWHRWGIEVVFTGRELDDAGVLVDFEIVKLRLRERLAPLEGADLNEHAFLGGAPSSAEHVARRLYEDLSAEDWGAAKLGRVIVREAPGCVAVFRGTAAPTAREH